MIPQKLQIKNFLSYGSDMQTIDFEPYHMICLSGKNGHGKSALLDALTWALWGHARKIGGVAKADEGLLRLGQQQMVVVLSFIGNGQQYQVRREYNKGNYNKAYVNLDFGVFDQEKQSFVPVGGKSVKSAQAALDEVIRLDYDSFCNSAFLRQGQSNEFSKKSPKERKDVLGAILGLSQYESIRKLASEKVRDTMTERIALQAVVERTKQELQNVVMIEQAMGMVHQQWGALTQQEQGLHARQKELQQRLLVMRDEQRQQQQIQVRGQEIAKKRVAVGQTIKELVSVWRSINAKRRSLVAPDNLEEVRRGLLNELDRQQEAMQVGLSLRERVLEIKKLFHEREQEVLRSHNQLLQTQQMTVERTVMEQQVLGEKIATMQQQIMVLGGQKRQYTQNSLVLQRDMMGFQQQVAVHQSMMLQFEKRKACYQQMITQGNLLRREQENFEHKKLLSEDDANPSCPLCEQNLSASRRRFLRQKFAKEELFLAHRVARIVRVTQKLKGILIQQHEEINVLQQAIERKKEAELQHQELNKRIVKIAEDQQLLEQQMISFIQENEQQKIKIAHEQEKLKNVQQALGTMVESNEGCRSLQAEIVRYESDLLRHRDDSRQLQETRSRLQIVEQQMTMYQEIVKQSSLQDQRKEEIKERDQEYKKYRQEEQSCAVALEQLERLAQQEEQLNQEIQKLDEEAKTLNEHKELLLQEKGSLENQRQKLCALEKEFKLHDKRQKEIEAQLDDYQAIIAATGKDGIQALLIQDVLPEIESEANQLIAKLTDNQAQIFIESLRDLKKGGTKETLDINISDGLGIRPYEMFSGGEAFRIDFALRIAISKLLARRAGTSLQTLIIDEGFGSQDEEGLSLIMDALYKIQDDFAKVIIVSHLPSMKDQFPVQFYVEKRATGSSVEVIEQG